VIAEFVQTLARELPAVPIYVGLAGLDEHAHPPRLVVVPERETVEPPTSHTFPPLSGRPIYVRRVRLSLYLWASTYSDVEGMLAEVLTALRQRLGAVAQPRDGEWMEGGAIALGVAYRLGLEVVAPVEEQEQYVVLEHLAMECGG
jgi:hypothetical protein